MTFLNLPWLTGITIRMCAALGIDHRAHVVSLLRGFPDKVFCLVFKWPICIWFEVVAVFRKAASPTGCCIIGDSWASSSHVWFRRPRACCSAWRGKSPFCEETFPSVVWGAQLLTNSLSQAEKRLAANSTAASGVTVASEAMVFVPGSRCPVRNYWLYPVAVDQPDQTMKALNDVGTELYLLCWFVMHSSSALILGIDAYRGATQLALVNVAPEHASRMQSPSLAKRLMDKTVLLRETFARSSWVFCLTCCFRFIFLSISVPRQSLSRLLEIKLLRLLVVWIRVLFFLVVLTNRAFSSPVSRARFRIKE